MKYLAIVGTGASLPEKKVGLADFLANGADPATLTEWDVGEHFVGTTETATDLEARASIQAIERAGWKPEDIDLIIGSTLLPEKINPTNVSLTQHKIGAKNAAVFEVDMACIGPVPALMIADALYKAGLYKKILVVASCQLQGAMDHSDPAVFAVCGDGAGAVVLGEVDEPSGVVGTHMTANGQYWDNVGIEVKGPKANLPNLDCDVRHRFYIDHQRSGDVKKFFEWAMASVPSAVGTLLEKLHLSLDQVDWVCPHQNVKTVSEAWIERIGVPPAKVVETRKEYGNCGPANVLLNLNRGAEHKKFKHGDHVLLFGQGSGMSVGTLMLRWHGAANPNLT